MTLDEAARALSLRFPGHQVGYVPPPGEPAIVVYLPTSHVPLGLPTEFEGYAVTIRKRVGRPQPL